jgi:hypothetical protein
VSLAGRYCFEQGIDVVCYPNAGPSERLVTDGLNFLVLQLGRFIDGRCLVVQRRVRSLGIVYSTRQASIVVRASSIDINQCWFKHSSRNLALNASMNGLETV